MSIDIGMKVLRAYKTELDRQNKWRISSASILNNGMDDFVGKQFGQLTITARAEPVASGRTRWAYVCDCGTTGIIRDDNLKKGLKIGKPYSCGCNQGNGSHQAARQNVIGQKFHRLTVLSFATSKARTKVKCRCDCGKEIECSLNSLRRNNTKSCGCWHKEAASISGCKHSKNALRTRIRWFHIKDGKKIRMRSCYEVMFAEILDQRGVDWKYEPKLFKLKDGMRYRPDFYVASMEQWYEVKGYMTEIAQFKVNEFKRQGNKLDVILLDHIETEHPISYRMFRKQWIKENL